jgi:hypothetical protein
LRSTENPDRITLRPLDNTRHESETVEVDLPRVSWNVIRLRG